MAQLRAVPMTWGDEQQEAASSRQRRSDRILFCEGERIYLRPIEVADEFLLRKWVNDPSIRQGLDHLPPTNAVREQAWIENQATNGREVHMAIAVRAGGSSHRDDQPHRYRFDQPLRRVADHDRRRRLPLPGIRNRGGRDDRPVRIRGFESQPHHAGRFCQQPQGRSAVTRRRVSCSRGASGSRSIAVVGTSTNTPTRFSGKTGRKRGGDDGTLSSTRGWHGMIAGPLRLRQRVTLSGRPCHPTCFGRGLVRSPESGRWLRRLISSQCSDSPLEFTA